MSEVPGFNPENIKISPPRGELKRIDSSHDFRITPEMLTEEGFTFYLGSTARITIERDEKSPTGLSVYTPFSNERHIFLKPGVNWVGRSKDCDIEINLADVSRFHAYISVSQDEIFVGDNDSTNGLMIET